MNHQTTGFGWKSSAGRRPRATITGDPKSPSTTTPTKSNNLFDLFGFEGADEDHRCDVDRDAEQVQHRHGTGRARPSKMDAPNVLTTASSPALRPRATGSLAVASSRTDRFADAFAAPDSLTTATWVRARVPRPARAEGDADLAGPDPGRGSFTMDGGCRGIEGEDPFVAPVPCDWSRRLRHQHRTLHAPTTSSRQRRAHSPFSQKVEVNRPGSAQAVPGHRLIQKIGQKISLADLIVLGGSAAVEEPAEVPHRREGRLRAAHGRVEHADVELLRAAGTEADGFRSCSGRRRFMAPRASSSRARFLG